MKLTEREAKLLASIADGATTAETAAVVWLTSGTLRVYLSGMYKRIGVRNRVQAAVWWTRQEIKREARSASKANRAK